LKSSPYAPLARYLLPTFTVAGNMQNLDQHEFYLQVGTTETCFASALAAYVHLCKYHAKLVAGLGRDYVWDFCVNGAYGDELHLGTDFAWAEATDGGEVWLFCEFSGPQAHHAVR
jgi:hypothetical protein